MMALAFCLMTPASARAATTGSDGLRISGTPAASVQIGHPYSFQPTVSDPSGRRVTFSISNHPGWSTFNRTTGLLSGTKYRTTGTYSNIVISASDGRSTVSLPAFTIRVVVSSVGGGGTTTPTVTITGSPATSVQAGQAYKFQPTAKDSGSAALAFSVRNKPSWASFSIATGALTGTPTSSNAGMYSSIVISASDGTANAALPAFSIGVTAPTTPPSSPPTIAGSPDTGVTAGQSYSFTPTATNPSGGTLTFAISNMPAWATFNASTGQLSGTPSAASVGTYANIGISVSNGTQSASLAAFTISVAAASTASTAGAPLVLYTDVNSGPNSGGENNEGAYLSIFGKNFGSSGLGSTVKVYIGGTEVNGYRYLGPSRGRSDVQQIAVQVGSLGSPSAGTALPIKVVVNGVASNTDQTFTVNAGRMLFVSQSGNDSTAVPGDITHPYRHVQNGSNGAFDVAQPGDTIVMRGTPVGSAALTSDPTAATSAWTDLYSGYFLRFINKNGSAPTGASGSGPISLIAYPDEDVYIYESYASGASGAITGVDTHQYTGGKYVTVADLRVEAGGANGGIDEQVAGLNWRVVNNEVTAVTGSTDTHNLEAAIVGSGTNSFWVGNHVHDINSASPMEMHGIYVDGDGSYEVAYNWIQNVTDGSGFQVYTDDGYASTTNNVSFHHNMISGSAKYGINIADGSANNFAFYDNVVAGAGWGCLRFNTNTLNGAKIYNNTFFNCVTRSGYGVVNNDWNFPTNALDMENNILDANGGTPYSGGSVGMTSGIGTVTNNLFANGSSGGDGWDSHPVLGDPQFTSSSATAPDLHLQTGSPAIGAGSTRASSAVTTDYDLKPRSTTSIDIGAYTH